MSSSRGQEGPASATDYYTPEQVASLWDKDWLKDLRRGPWMSGTKEVNPINPLYDSYHPYACHTCKRCALTNNTKLFNCTGCRVVKYCSRNHQVSDWKYHKELCKAFQKVKQREGGPRALSNLDEWRKHSIALSGVIVCMTKDTVPHSMNLQIIIMQPRCRRCFTAQSDGTNLIACPRCNGVALCKDCHESQQGKSNMEIFHPHSSNPGGIEECNGHLLALCCAGMVVEMKSPLVAVSESDESTPCQPRTWMEYFDLKRNKFPSPIPRGLMYLAPVIAFVTDCLSLALTVQHVLALPELGIKENSRLVIHVLGATFGESITAQCFVELIRLNPHLTYLQVVLIGPEVIEDLKDASKVTLRDSYVRAGCEVKVLWRSNLYHEVTLEEEPTIIIAQHPGIHDLNYTSSWKRTIEKVADKDVPFCFTGFNHKEVENGVETIQRLCGINIVLPARPNPFRGLRPFLDPTRDPSDFYYSDASFAVAKGRA